MINVNTKNIIEKLVSNNPDTSIFKKATIVDTAKSLGFSKKDWTPLLETKGNVRGQYDLSAVILPLREESHVNNTTLSMQSIVNKEKSFASIDDTFVPWGPFKDISKVISAEMFYPIYISGMSGNGKTFMVEQACAKMNREFIRVQINPETDEDDLLGGFRLIDGETVFAKGPVLKAMENGAILLLDEIDRATNKIMCLQGILEGKPVLVKKTGETISPQPGFNVIATANTKGKGSDDGRFTAASIIDEAFLERFTISIDQKFPTKKIETKIVMKHMAKFNKIDGEFADKLTTWADIIRKTFDDDGVDEIISTRRLCHIVQSYAIFKNRLKAIDLCITRFDEDTREAFLDLYTKVDSGVVVFEDEVKAEDNDE
tara:strand:+ start:300 stop:1418 length:1119 start_codon:yes stop_codon:yes gene_type:complete